MKRLLAFIAAPRTQVFFNGIATLVWLVMVPVTLLVEPLRTAIFYVALMSVWANFATHLGGWIAAMVNRNVHPVHQKLDHIIEHHPDIPPLTR